MGIAYVMSILASTLVALTLSPALCALLLSRAPLPAESSWVERTAVRLYSPILNLALITPRRVLALALATVVDGLRTTLTQRFESADQASVTTTLLGDDNTLALSAVNVSVLNYLVAVNGANNLLSLSAENATNARLDLEVLGNRNTISTLQRDVSDASIQVRLKGSDNQLTIEQSATPGL